MAAERRIDPSDGRSYTFDEILSFYTGTYKKAAVRSYWDTECRLAKTKQPRGVQAASEVSKVDPSDGLAYTFKELSDHYKGTYTTAAVQSYWDTQCTANPARTSRRQKARAARLATAPAAGKAEVAEKAPPRTEKPGKSSRKGSGKGSARAARSGPANPKRFIDDEAKIVQDSIDGLIWATPNIARLDAYPSIKVVVRTDWDKDKVAIISGGGAGHEPMHAGFVAKGMLTAAVCGETFASPTIDAVLAAIVQVTGPKGCLLVIKNYTGDRLNFSMAAQRAHLEFGLKVETVITQDDVATTAKRGVAGTLFVHKVAGAVAEAGGSLADVKAAAESVVSASSSMGVSFSSVRRLKAEMIGIKKMEVGLGIHGEPGARTEDVAPASKVVEVMLEGLLKEPKMQEDAPHGFACLVNNLGSVPCQEMSIIVASLMKSQLADKIKLLIGPAQLCTSLDMNGVSLSLLRLSPEMEGHLKAETAAVAWPKAVAPHFPTPVESLHIKDPMEGVTPSADEAVAAVLQKVCKALVDSKTLLDTIDGKVGDADCGTTMAGAATSILEAKDKLPLADPGALCRCLSAICGQSMGGSSGVLMGIMFLGMAKHFEASESKTWAGAGPKAFGAGLQEMMAAGGAAPGSRTMLDALIPAREALEKGEGWAGAKAAAEAGAESTKKMPPRAGRSENVPESVWQGVEDPGAKAAAIVFAALVQ